MLCVYIAIATASISHHDLLLDASIKMPVLGIDLPVTGYFAVAPVILLISHVYLLLQLYQLFAKLAAYQDVLRRTMHLAAERRLMRLRLDDFPFVRLFATSSDTSLLSPQRILLQTICWVTLCLVPLIVLLQLFLAFLPFHSEATGWLQRSCILIDMVLSWLFWPDLPGPSSRRAVLVKRSVTGAAVACVTIFAVFLATFPGEPLHRNVVKAALDRIYQAGGGAPNGLSKLLFEGDVDAATGGTTSLFANRLVLPDARLFTPAGSDSPPRPVSLRGRDLRGAIFRRADLRFADLTDADLTDAAMAQANLQGAKMGCAQVESLDLDERRTAKVVRSSCTRLASADLSDTHLEGAVLTGADLRGTRFRGAHAQGAHFDSADLSAADLEYTLLYGADFTGAKMIGTGFFHAEAMGTNFSDADLRTASLLSAQLQGADFSGANIALMAPTFAHLYRASFPRDPSDTIMVAVGTKASTGGLMGGKSRGWSEAAPSFELDKPAGYAALVERATLGIDDPLLVAAVRARLAILDPGTTPGEAYLRPTDRMAKRPARELSARRVAFIGDFLCMPLPGSFVAKGFLYNGRILGAGRDGPALLRRLSDPTTCPGIADFNAADKAALSRIAAQVRSMHARQEPQ